MLKDNEISDLKHEHYDRFVELAMNEIVEQSQSKNVVDELLASAINEDVRNDIAGAIARIRERKINDIVNEKQ